MSMFELCFEMRQICAVTGGASDSIFPAVDKLLGETDYQKALDAAFPRSKIGRHLQDRESC